MNVRNSSRGMRMADAVAEMFGSTKWSRPRGPRGEEADVVLPEDLAPEEGEHESELLVAHRPVEPARDARAGGVGPFLCLEQRALDPLEQDLERRDVEVDPLEPIHDRRRLERGGSAEPISSATIGSMRRSVAR